MKWLKTSTVKCRYNVVQIIMLLHMALLKQRQKITQIFESQQAPYISPSRASYGVSIVKIWGVIDRIITALHGSWQYIGKVWKLISAFIIPMSCRVPSWKLCIMWLRLWQLLPKDAHWSGGGHNGARWFKNSNLKVIKGETIFFVFY